MLTLKNTVVLVDQLLLQKWSVSNDWQTYAYKYKQVLIRKKCTVVYWWLYHCALEINTGNCTFLTYVNSHGSRYAQIYKCTNAEAQAVQHIVFCPLSILMNVPEENINAHSNNVVLNMGYITWKNGTRCF